MTFLNEFWRQHEETEALRRYDKNGQGGQLDNNRRIRIVRTSDAKMLKYQSAVVCLTNFTRGVASCGGKEIS